jgi:hypothetical protein
MVTIKFQGWFECRLATDPDPVDEPRGVSGYLKCLPEEPDFDRIIRFHNPLVNRSYTPKIGVYVTNIIYKNEVLINHALIGSEFNLEGNPVFYGFNGIIADDGFEPIVPFIISIKKNESIVIQRGIKDEPITYPFRDTFPSNGILIGGNDIAENTGIWDFGDVISKRIDLLQADLLLATDELEIFKLNQRIEFLKSPSSQRFFNARMNWNLPLRGEIKTENNPHFKISNHSPWSLNFWMGGWDPDGLCGYVSGILKIPNAIIH